MVIVPKTLPSGRISRPSFASMAAWMPQGHWRRSAIRPVNASTSSTRPSFTT